MKTTIRKVLPLAAVFVAVPAYADLADGERDPETQDQAEPIKTAASSRGSEGRAQRLSRSIEEIVVTAQKREERLQDVPVAVSVLSGISLDASTVQGVTEALNQVPGVVTTVPSNTNGATQVMIRGVTASGLLFSGSSPIAYYLDSVPFGFVRMAVAPDVNPYDLARVEVLRGPQGTLYGASAQNGVVRVLTEDANAHELEFKARTSLSSTDGGGENYRGDMALNIPIVEGKLAARAVVGYHDVSGWIDSANGTEDVNDGEIRTARLKLNAQPTDRLSIGLSAWISRSDFGAPSFGEQEGRRTLVTQFDESSLLDYDIFGARIDYEFGGFSVSSTSAYIDYANGGNLDLVGLAIPGLFLYTGLESEIFSQEVNLSSNTEGPWRWTLGGMYRDGEDRLHQYITESTPPGIFQLDFGQSSESYAIFGEVTRTLADGQLEITAGLRYFEDKVGDSENQLTTLATPPLIRREDTFDAVTPRVVLAWHPSDDLMVYGSYAEGFRSGFNQWALVTRTAPDYPPVDPDTLSNYEVGIKGDFWNSRVVLDSAIYYINWEDIQQLDLTFVNEIPLTVGVNGASASGIGVDFGVTLLPSDGIEFAINIGWNDLTLDDDVLDGTGNVVLAAGDRPNNSPELSMGAAASFAFSLGRSGFGARFSASANYTSKLDTVAAISNDPLLIAHTSFSVVAPDHWTASLFVDNVNNEQGIAQRYPGAPDWSQRVRPRTFGLQIEYRY